MKKLIILPIVGLILLTAGCDSTEKQAYKAFVASKAFLDSEKAQHPECPASATAVCQALTKATAAKDALIDAAEVYCSGPAFESGGACQPPAKGTPGRDQAITKLKAAIAVHDQALVDLKTLLGGK
jgi:hypothetical protein